MLQKILTSSRYTIAIAVVGCFLASLICLLIGGAQMINILIQVVQEGLNHAETKNIVASLFELIDLFLIAVVFYIVSLGLYELFIDDRLELPGWLVIHDLDDLKAKLTNGMVVVMIVHFLGNLLHGREITDLLPLSVSIAVIILALTVFQLVHRKNSEH